MRAGATPRSVVAVTVVALAITYAIVLTSGYEPIDMMRVGEQSTVAPLVVEQFGEGPLLKGNAGYDGAFFWATADQLPDLDAAASHLDDAPYRLQRILPSALAALAGGGQASAFALILLTLVGVAMCTGALADLAVRHGRPAQVGFLAMVPLIFPIFYITGEPIAFGFGLLGLCFADRRRHGLAVLCIVLGTLSRESVAVFGLAVILGHVVEQLRKRDAPPLPVLALYLIPLAIDLGWSAWLRQRYESREIVDRIVILGILDASTFGMLIGVVIVLAGVFGAWRWRDVPVVWATALAFSAGVFLYFGPLFILRAVPRVSAPALMLGLAGLVPRRADDRRPDEHLSA